MEHSFCAQITAFVKIPKEYFEFICESAAKHYDFTVRSSIEHNGFLYGMKNSRDYYKQYHPEKELDGEELTFRQIDLMCKAIEYPMTPLGMKITAEFRQILNGINETYVSINNQLQGKIFNSPF